MRRRALLRRVARARAAPIGGRDDGRVRRSAARAIGAHGWEAADSWPHLLCVAQCACLLAFKCRVEGQCNAGQLTGEPGDDEQEQGQGRICFWGAASGLIHHVICKKERQRTDPEHEDCEEGRE